MSDFLRIMSKRGLNKAASELFCFGFWLSVQRVNAEIQISRKRDP